MFYNFFNTSCLTHHVYLVEGAVMVVIVWQLDLQLPVQSVSYSITTNVVSLNPAHGEV